MPNRGNQSLSVVMELGGFSEAGGERLVALTPDQVRLSARSLRCQRCSRAFGISQETHRRQRRRGRCCVEFQGAASARVSGSTANSAP